MVNTKSNYCCLPCSSRLEYVICRQWSSFIVIFPLWRHHASKQTGARSRTHRHGCFSELRRRPCSATSELHALNVSALVRRQPASTRPTRGPLASDAYRCDRLTFLTRGCIAQPSAFSYVQCRPSVRRPSVCHKPILYASLFIIIW